MYVCLCQGISDKTIKEHVNEHGATTVRDIARSLGVAKQCGKCAQVAKKIIDQELQRNYELAYRVA